MKKICNFLLILLFISAATAVYADETTETTKDSNRPSTLFSSSESFSGYGAPVYKVSKIGDNYASLAGVRGGLIVNDQLVIGLNMTGLVYPIKRDSYYDGDYSGDEPNLGFGYGGLLLEYYFMPKSLVHFSIGATIGGGGIGFADNDDDDNHHPNSQAFFVVEPEINAFVNLTTFCRIGAGVTYRYTIGINKGEFDDSDMSGLNAQVFVSFGAF